MNVLFITSIVICSAAAWPRDFHPNFYNDGSGEEFSGELPGFEGSGEISPDQLTVHQLHALAEYADRTAHEAQKLIHQSHHVMNEMHYLASTAQSLAALSAMLRKKSEMVLQNAIHSMTRVEVITTDNTIITGHPAPLCTPSAICYSHEDCKGGNCIGAHAGTCNCNGCIHGWPCQNDVECGGFQGSCIQESATCDCFSGFAHNNMTLSDALTSFCNIAKCDGTDNLNHCHGLSCNYGFCAC